MTFEYDSTLINLLDTLGHKDFAEDTYRTLAAVDSVILVVDCVKVWKSRRGKTGCGLSYVGYSGHHFHQ